MAKVLCTLKNASELINGVIFIEHELGKISEEISDEVAAVFAKIPGYELIASAVKEVKAKVSKAAQAPAAAEAPAAPAAPAAPTAQS